MKKSIEFWDAFGWGAGCATFICVVLSMFLFAHLNYIHKQELNHIIQKHITK